MTVLSEPVAGKVTVIEDAPPPAKVPVGRRDRARRIGTLTVVVAISLLAVYAFFSSFVTRLWFDNRQRALAGAGISLVAPKTGSSVGTLQVQQPFTLNVQLVQGDGPDQLRAGPGHQPGSTLPGNLGNSIIYGHANEWGAPFKSLKEATKGTELYLRTPKATLLGYTVTFAKVMPAARVAAYLGRSTDYRLTLVTDAGGRFSHERLVVVAISGTQGRLSPARPGTPTGPGQPSPFGTAFLELVGWVVLTAGVAWLLARAHSRTAVIVAATPLAMAALVAAFLELGLLWSPLA